MQNLQRTSYALTAAGLLVVIAAALLELGASWLLAGILLAFAGAVKIAIVLIWSRVASLGTDDHQPTPGP